MQGCFLSLPTAWDAQYLLANPLKGSQGPLWDMEGPQVNQFPKHWRCVSWALHREEQAGEEGQDPSLKPCSSRGGSNVPWWDRESGLQPTSGQVRAAGLFGAF